MATLLDSLGNQVFVPKPTSAWFGAFNIRHTAADAAGSFVAAITNPAASGIYLYIRYIRCTIAFDGTAAAATSLVYEVVRYSSATTPSPTTGTTLTRVRRDTRLATPVILDANAQYKSGVLTLGPTVIDSIKFLRMPASVTNGVLNWDLDFIQSDKLGDAFVIGPNEGVGIRLTNTAVIGQGISGNFSVDERLTASAL